MASYTKIDIRTANEILALYGDYIVADLLELSHGISNTNYKVTLNDATNLILKISNDKDFQQLVTEQEILIQLKEAGFHYSLVPNITLNNQLVYSFKGYVGTVYPFVEGAVAKKIDKELCFKIGKALGELHLCSEKNSDKIKNIRAYSEIGFKAKHIFDYCQTSDSLPDFKKSFTTYFTKKFIKSIEGVNFPRGIIHGDLYYDNVLLDHNEIVALLDFEQAGFSNFILDIGISISGTCLENNVINHSFIDSFIDGYESVRKMVEIEMTYIHEAIMIGLYSISLWRIMRFTVGDIDKSKNESYKELINIAENFSTKRYIYGN